MISEDEIDIPYPPFPVDILPAVLKETVSNICEKTNIPGAIIAYQCLGILSGVVGNSIQSKLGSLPIYPNLFIIGVEYSGIGKTKSASILCRGLRQALSPWIDESNAKRIKAEMEWEELNKLYKKQFRENEQKSDSQEPGHDLQQLANRITILQRQKNIRGDIIISDITPEKWLQPWRECLTMPCFPFLLMPDNKSNHCLMGMGITSLPQRGHTCSSLVMNRFLKNEKQHSPSLLMNHVWLFNGTSKWTNSIN